MGDEPTLAILTEMEGNSPIPNRPPFGALLWEWEVEDDLFPADDDGLF